ncbi:MAG TPA: helix-turn-helix transcriptional regulator [Caulobacterales bacterium]|nr:helix-turn-helix transcriptional regulator [Caulobacterales bacterium]
MPGETSAERGFGVRLKEVRVNAGLTQQELADRIGVSRKTINTVENGVFIPSTLLALRLAETLGVKVEDLFHLED